MVRKWCPAAVVVLFAVVGAQGEQIRTTLTKENKFPELRRPELGFLFRFEELEDESEGVSGNDTNLFAYVPFVRYRVFEPLTVFATVPFVTMEPDRGSTEGGLGDITLGLEWLAWQDVFDYPWIIPHVEWVIPSGDDDDGLGQGENSFILGLALGSTAYEVLHFQVDVRYEIFQDDDNIASLAGSIIWDLSERFAIFGEAKLADEEDEVDDNERPATFLGGVSFKPTDKLTITASGGAVKNSRRDAILIVRTSYDI